MKMLPGLLLWTNCGKASSKNWFFLPCKAREQSFDQLWHIFLFIHLNNIFHQIKPLTMLRWTVIFLIVAIIAAIFGFGGIAAGAAGIAKILFFIFLVLFVLSLLFGRRTTDV
jgi:uncharacterized membrane protein YtjA (UPF0391 family)